MLFRALALFSVHIRITDKLALRDDCKLTFTFFINLIQFVTHLTTINSMNKVSTNAFLATVYSTDEHFLKLVVRDTAGSCVFVEVGVNQYQRDYLGAVLVTLLFSYCYHCLVFMLLSQSHIHPTHPSCSN